MFLQFLQFSSSTLQFIAAKMPLQTIIGRGQCDTLGNPSIEERGSDEKSHRTSGTNSNIN